MRQAFLLWLGVVLGLTSAGLVAHSQELAFAHESSPASQLVFRSWRTDAGLPHNTVNAIVQTHDGYLWVGTRDGLARFDGVRFTIFGLREGLQSVEVQTLYEDRQGTLWIGTSGGGLSRWTAGRLETVQIPEHLEGSDTVTALAEDGAGRLWVGTLAGLAVADDGQFIQIEQLKALERLGIRALRCNRSGAMWIATLSHGLFEFSNDRLRECRGPQGNDRILAYCLLDDTRSNLWASVGNGTLLSRRGQEWERYTETNGLPFAYVTCLAEDQSGTLWAGSLDDGLYFLQGGRFEACRKEQGLSANDIRSLCVDREGHVWVGTRTGGLGRVSPRKLVSIGAAQGLTNDYTRSVAETADGVLWVGTTGGGLYRSTPEGFRSFAPYFASVDSVLAAKDGSLWWGAARGLFCRREGKVVEYTNEPWLGPAAVTALAEDGRGGLWAGTSAGRLAHFEQGAFKEFAQRVARGPITGLAQEPDGALWVGSVAGGLRRIRTEQRAVESLTNGLPSQAVRTLYLDGQRTLWIGTAGGGLSCYRNGKVATFTAAQGFNANTVVQIVEDDSGFLWLGTGRGVLRVRKSDLIDVADGRLSFLHPRSFGINEGMPAEECSSGFCPAGLKTKAGLICISTVKGLAFFDPKLQATNSPAPEVYLEEISVNGNPQSPELVQTWHTAPHPPGALRSPAPPGSSGANARDGERGRAPGSQEIRPTEGADLASLTLAPGARQLEIRYTGLSFESPEALRFRYRLEGLDQDWIEAGERRTAYYHNVPAGHFVFHVIACNADGVWSPDGPALALTVQPYVWESTWFLTVAALAAVGAVALASRVVERRRYRRRLAVVETRAAVERERLRISQDMHDDIGSILTQVSQLSDLGQSDCGDAGATRAQFERIGGQARSAVQALDEIVWATNPKNDNLAQFAEYVCRFADELFETSRVRCWQEVPTALPKCPLTADVRHNVFLALKEAFTNVLKHSGATEVWLRLAIQNTEVSVTVEDNGGGLDFGAIPPGSNGLENMKMRLSECGGRVEIKSVPGNSTTVRFIFPLAESENDPGL